MHNDDNDNKGMNLQLEIKPEVASGTYSNMVLISHSHADFVLDFAQNLPGMHQPVVSGRVIMAPEHAKRFLRALMENVSNYEREFGTIDLGESGPRTIAPFGKGRENS